MALGLVFFLKVYNLVDEDVPGKGEDPEVRTSTNVFTES
jgi:hypothetical protein